MLRILLSLLFLSLSTLSWANSVETLRFSHSDAKTRIVFDLSAEVNYKSFTLQNPDRLVIDIQDTQSASLHQLPDLTGTPVKNIRYAKRNKNTLRIVLDLDKPLDYETQVLPPNQDKIHRLVLDLIDNNSSDVIVTKKIEKIETQPVVEKVENKVIPQTPTVQKQLKHKLKPAAILSSQLTQAMVVKILVQLDIVVRKKKILCYLSLVV